MGLEKKWETITVHRIQKVDTRKSSNKSNSRTSTDEIFVEQV